jgi:hypothetical protein
MLTCAPAILCPAVGLQFSLQTDVGGRYPAFAAKGDEISRAAEVSHDQRRLLVGQFVRYWHLADLDLSASSMRERGLETLMRSWRRATLGFKPRAAGSIRIADCPKTSASNQEARVRDGLRTTKITAKRYRPHRTERDKRELSRRGLSGLILYSQWIAR